jgi:acetyl coenzyme A synthetase (ADP forming)-like protein
MAVPDEFFNPRSVAIIGASRYKGKVGHEVLRNFVKKFKGNIFCVNPRARSILGKACYASVSSIPKPIDLAVITTPSSIVPQVLQDCVAKKVPAVILITSGFGELGELGRKKEAELRKIISNSNTRVLGPNCMGMISAVVDTNFNPEEKQKRPKAGNIAFLSQSGAVGSTIIDFLAEEGIGISSFVSYGNQTDIDESDFIEYFGSDKSTKVITMYLEGVKYGQKFLHKSKSASKVKPILAIKAGKTSSGEKAVMSHTGALAGSSAVYSGIFKQAGIIEVDSWEELFDAAVAFSTQPLPKGNRLAVVTDGGGFGVLAADAADKLGLALPAPPPSTLKVFREKFPPYVAVKNPIDLTGDADVDRYKIAIEECLRSKEYDGVLAITLFQLPSLDPAVADVMIQLKKRYKKPLLVCSTGSAYTQKIARKLEANGIPVYPTPERAVAAYAALCGYKSS